MKTMCLCAVPFITTMTLWQLMHLGIGFTVGHMMYIYRERRKKKEKKSFTFDDIKFILDKRSQISLKSIQGVGESIPKILLKTY